MEDQHASPLKAGTAGSVLFGIDFSFGCGGCFFVLFFEDEASLSSPGCPGTFPVD